MVNSKKVDTYTITNQTMVISPNYDPIYQTKIYERDEVYLCKQTPLKIIDSSCIKQGAATFKGRKQAAEHVTGKKVMLPIPVEPYKGIILMPTKKVKDPYCTWIAYCHVKEIQHLSKNKNETELIFYNDQTYRVEIPPTRMQNQILLASFVFGYFIKEQYIS
ncbi:competence protein ComK [Aquisalibacillus elongatus]|uniref:Competence protein ComK n=1 Tax=Aquisalibacillus elongatus TaxID=485577 RepID=A0A3N5B9P9_9BACI|nr:competence protein ComK [Aquisalibacillus elongatus]RPF54133.1 competence protein ComK [Aquisalibacillus elongatus]